MCKGDVYLLVVVFSPSYLLLRYWIYGINGTAHRWRVNEKDANYRGQQMPSVGCRRSRCTLWQRVQRSNVHL